MHEKAPLLSASTRDKFGSRYCARLRDQGQLPAVLYGHKEAPVPITIPMRDAVSHITKGEKVFRLDFPGAKDQTQMVLLKELQFDYLGTNIVHADFARVSLTERVKTRVAIHLVGEAKGLKQAGAILMHPTNEVEVETTIAELPDFLEVNIAELDVGHAITAAEVQLPNATMKMITDPHSIVAQIVIQLEEKVAEAAVVGADAAAPEVLTAKKAEGDAAGKPAAAGAKPAAGAAAKPAAGGGDKKK